MPDVQKKYSMLTLLLAGLLAFLWVIGAGCEKLEEGKCKRDSHCEDMAKTEAEVWICYKEPPGANMGDCMRVKDARAAQAKYKDKNKNKPKP